MNGPEGREFLVREGPRVPLDGLIFGVGAMLPILAGSVGAWFSGSLSSVLVTLVTIWSGAIVAFLSGVRRGLGFRSPHGPDVPQLASMLWLFALAVAALVLMPSVAATACLVVGFVSIAVLDTWASRRGDAPVYFGRLRPLQMVIPVVSLILLLAFQATR